MRLKQRRGRQFLRRAWKDTLFLPWWSHIILATFWYKTVQSKQHVNLSSHRSGPWKINAEGINSLWLRKSRTVTFLPSKFFVHGIKTICSAGLCARYSLLPGVNWNRKRIQKKNNKVLTPTELLSPPPTENFIPGEGGSNQTKGFERTNSLMNVN